MTNSVAPTKMNELHDSDVPPGIYVGLLVSPESKERIYKFCKDTLSLDMNNSESPYEKRSHATLFSAQESKGHTLDNFVQFMEEKEFLAKGVKWEIWQSPYTQKKCLVLKIESQQMIEFHNQLGKKTGLEHVFPDYLPHVSIHYDYQGELPTVLPTFAITLQEMYSKPYFFKNKKDSKNDNDNKNDNNNDNNNDNKNDNKNDNNNDNTRMSSPSVIVQTVISKMRKTGSYKTTDKLTTDNNLTNKEISNKEISNMEKNDFSNKSMLLIGQINKIRKQLQQFKNSPGNKV